MLLHACSTFCAICDQAQCGRVVISWILFAKNCSRYDIFWTKNGFRNYLWVNICLVGMPPNPLTFRLRACARNFSRATSKQFATAPLIYLSTFDFSCSVNIFISQVTDNLSALDLKRSSHKIAIYIQVMPYNLIKNWMASLLQLNHN